MSPFLLQLGWCFLRGIPCVVLFMNFEICHCDIGLAYFLFPAESPRKKQGNGQYMLMELDILKKY